MQIIISIELIAVSLTLTFIYYRKEEKQPYQKRL